MESPVIFISIIVPAFNESFELGRTLSAVFESLHQLGVPSEVLVVNDASTDETADIARKAGARVIDVNLRQISAVRNAGARESKGDVLFFIDADTRISPAVMQQALGTIEKGAVGGGAWVQFAEPVGWPARLALPVFNQLYMGLLRWAAGCFLFARRPAFEAAGGFDEALFASEEIFLSIALKRQGRFVIVPGSVVTSGRKLRLNSPWKIIPFLFRFLVSGFSMLRQRDGLDWWYDGQREKSHDERKS